MASSLKAHDNRKNETLHFKLAGDFDGKSAHELVSAIKDNSAWARKIYIHTNDLRSLRPFGLSALIRRLSLPDKSLTFIFTGQYAEEISSGLKGPFHRRIKIKKGWNTDAGDYQAVIVRTFQQGTLAFTGSGAGKGYPTDNQPG